MKIFLSYGHDSNAPLIEKIKGFVLKDADENLKHEVWKVCSVGINQCIDHPNDMKENYHFGEI